MLEGEIEVVLKMNMQPCGHPVEAIRSGRDKGPYTSNWCGWCEEVGQLRAEIARLREALDEVWSWDRWLLAVKDVRVGSKIEYRCRCCEAVVGQDWTAPHAPDCPFAALSPDDDWLERHDAEVRGQCLSRRFPMPLRAISNLLSPVKYSHDAQVVRSWLDEVTDAIREGENGTREQVGGTQDRAAGQSPGGD